MPHMIRGAKRVSKYEECQHTQERLHKFEFEVTDYTSPVLSMENTFSVHVTVETTQNIVEISTVHELVI